MTADGPAVFAYGTLLFPEVVEIVVGRRLPVVPATLADHRRARLVDRVYPGIVEHASVLGKELRRLPDSLADLRADDLLERVGRHRSRGET
jgi:hypothetical protein